MTTYSLYNGKWSRYRHVMGSTEEQSLDYIKNLRQEGIFMVEGGNAKTVVIKTGNHIEKIPDFKDLPYY